MDLHVEQQCVDNLRTGDASQLLLLFDAYVDPLYKYVRRRVSDSSEAEKITRLVFLDALGQVQNTPNDVVYLVWLYSLAKPRVWDFISSDIVIEREPGVESEKSEIVARAEKMMGKMSLEEREILRLKFFEQVSDGDVMSILGIDQGTIGPKIYRVLKRAHFLLFGESDERQGVYFGELSGFLAGIREMEKITVPEAFKMNLRADISSKIERRDFAIDAELLKEKKEKDAQREEREAQMKNATGSNDPAKIFVEAVQELKEEEEILRERERERHERRERALDVLDRWKAVFVVVPALIFVLIASFFVFKLFDFKFGMVKRGFPTICDIEVEFEGDFTDKEKRSVNEGISDRLCGHFEVESLLIIREESGVVNVELDVPDWFLEYRFVQKVERWKIKKYARTFNSDEQSGEV